MSKGPPLSEVVDGRIYRGVQTADDGLFIVDKPTRDRLVILDPRCAPLLRRVLRAVDLRPWHQHDQAHYLLVLRPGVDLDRYAPINNYLAPHRERLERLAPAGRRWYELPDPFEEALLAPERLAWPVQAGWARCSLLGAGPLLGGDCGFTPVAEPFLLGLIASRIAAWLLPRLDTAGDPVAQLPVPPAPDAVRAAIGEQALALMALARDRHTLDLRVQQRTLRDFGPLGALLSPALRQWWLLDFDAFRTALLDALKNDIPARYRDEWELWLAEQRQQYAEQSEAIARLEVDLNRLVDDLFELTPAQIGTIEALGSAD
ncbi:MAG TPA: hypothetical protein VFS21_19770 [Roseiflexaceae bacterium]|nr:hypothetical protein [Roseiflexaceae bacterium]